MASIPTCRQERIGPSRIATAYYGCLRRHHSRVLKFYFDGALVGTINCQYNPALSATAALSVIDSRHLALILGTGGSPTTVYNVQVWQASAAHDVPMQGTPVPTPDPPPSNTDAYADTYPYW